MSGSQVQQNTGQSGAQSGAAGSTGADPSMEDILASIRRILSEEDEPTAPEEEAGPEQDVLLLDASMLVADLPRPSGPSVVARSAPPPPPPILMTPPASQIAEAPEADAAGADVPQAESTTAEAAAGSAPEMAAADEPEPVVATSSELAPDLAASEMADEIAAPDGAPPDFSPTGLSPAAVAPPEVTAAAEPAPAEATDPDTAAEPAPCETPFPETATDAATFDETVPETTPETVLLTERRPYTPDPVPVGAMVNPESPLPARTGSPMLAETIPALTTSALALAERDFSVEQKTPEPPVFATAEPTPPPPSILSGPSLSVPPSAILMAVPRPVQRASVIRRPAALTPDPAFTLQPRQPTATTTANPPTSESPSMSASMFTNGLASPETATAVAGSVTNLVRAQMSDRGQQVFSGGPTIADLVREEMRPMLKDWLDSNLPPLVERLVRAEIERVISRAAV